MATIVELTQVQLSQETGGKNYGGQNGPIGIYWIPESAKPISINQAHIIGVGYYWDVIANRILDGIVQVYLSSPLIVPIVVTDSYATIEGYIAANP